MAERLDSPLRREQIADAALTIVMEQGVGGVTVRRVAEAVGISAAALYRHYKNKNDILAAVLEEHNAILMANLRRAKEESSGPLDTLRLLFDLTMGLVERYRALPVIFLSDVLWFEETRLRDLKLAHHEAMRDTLIEVIERGQQAGSIRKDIRAQEIFVHYLGLIAMPAMMLARSPQEIDLPQQVVASWLLFEKAVAA